MSLTEVAYYFRIGVKVFMGLFIMYYLVVFVFYPLGKVYYKKLFPPKNPPTVAYGILPEIAFEKKPVLGQSQNYVLNTKNGALPTDFPDRMTVYKIFPAARSFEASKRASADATILGFTDADLVTDVKGDILRWYSSKTQGNLQIQTQTRELFMEIPLLNKSSNFPQGSISQTTALSKATTLLNNISRLDGTAYAQGTQSIYSGKFQANKISNSIAPFEYQIARVDFFRNIDKYPILGPDPKEGLIQIWVTAPKEGTIGKLDFPKIQYYYKEINTRSEATYPIIQVAAAWENVSKGKGIIANVTPKDGSMFEVAPPQRVDKILINSVKLAYLETKLPQEYIQPIYVFEGNYTGVGSSGSITIYYPAIDPAYTATK